jgi:AraC-like DNA-binding protein
MVTASPQTDLRIQRVAEVLTKDPSCPLSELARTCQISTSRLSHLFKIEMGMNLKIYRQHCRLQLADAMLVSTMMPIKAIAYSSGYRHTSSFARAFKTHLGVSPASYRKGRGHQAA